MPRRRKSEDRVLGPYPHKRGARIIIVGPTGGRTHKVFSTEKEAFKMKRETERLLGLAAEKTIREALTDYEVFLRDVKGNRPLSVAQTKWRVETFFADLDVPVRKITPERAARCYAALTERTRTVKVKEGDEVVGKRVRLSSDTHRNALIEARSFLKWCVGKAWLPANPLAGVEGIGKRRHGKEQPTVDEARKWYAAAMKLADEGEDGAVAALVTLLMGFRCSEVVSRQVRDLDDNGRLLRVPRTKTEKGRRIQEIPAVLRPYLLELAEGKKAHDLLFGYHDRAWPRKWVQRICAKSGVTRVTAHGMRGAHSTLATAHGITAHVVAAALGHASSATTLQSYVKPDAVANARQEKALAALEGTAA